tara:strand:+ start:51 stop:2891 length:2841 start_codon:yes stop_codon:yes gene_type:complete
MQLEDYIPNVKKKYSKISFSGIAFDSSKIKRNFIFFAIKGKNFDGNNFIPIAIKKGCRVIITEKKIKKKPKGILFINTKNVRKLLAEVSFKIYKNRPRNLIAVTGTNGKSSVSDFYYQILKLNNKKVASIGTLGVKSDSINFDLSNTTTDPIHLGIILKKLKKKGVENIIMEASSHGLKQNRLDGLLFNSGIFTNFSQDHLDYHKNLDDYLKAKLYLFKNLIKTKGNIITDDKLTEFSKIKKISNNRNLKLRKIDNKSSFKILSHSYKGDIQVIKIQHKRSIKIIKINLIGKIQLKNILMAIIAAEESNLSLERIFKVIPKIIPVNGRFEKIGKIKNNSKVILDYAHTPEALKTCILNLKEQFKDKKVSLLFGCGGNRDQNKRSKMGKVASDFSDRIYLTNDNPRYENPKKIRRDIKKGIKNRKVIEISDRSKAISLAIKNLNSGEILLIAGKGHEKTQDFGKRKIYFSDKDVILNSIKKKNLNLSNDLKSNILKELSGNQRLLPRLSWKLARINSQEVSKNDIFFAIKGKKNDGNKFVNEAFKKKASITVVNKIQKRFQVKRQIKVKNTLKFLTDVSRTFRTNINTRIIAITGSCGKTTLKELLGDTLKQVSKVSISPKSYNNKYGVPLSLLNLKENDDFGILEVGMDKKGEIDYLSKIIKPDISVITNINFAHAKNFKKIEHIALAKSEIIQNTKPGGFVVLNADDSFFNLHKKIAIKNDLRIVSFGMKNKISSVKFLNIKKNGNHYKLYIKSNRLKKYFLVSNNFQNSIYNILAALSIMSIHMNIFRLNKNIFLNFKVPQGRGDLSKIKIFKKNINLVDESYNSNPLSLKSAILNFDKMFSKKFKKYLLLGDMLELGNHSKKLHQSIAATINKTKIDKVFIKGHYMKYMFEKLYNSKKGRVLSNKSQIIDLIKNDLNNNDSLMVKASNATGFNEIMKKIKGIR